jgi:GMP synthase (glutamine-hydrolysing)
MAKVLGGKVKSSPNREYGHAKLIVDKRDDFFNGLTRNLPVWMSHGDRVLKLPAGFHIIAHTSNSPIAAMRDKEKKLYGVQFHPEVVHTPQGIKIMDNFLRKIAGCHANWTISSFIRDSIKSIREEVKNDRVICALSGGVDSSVLSVLLNKAIGNKSVCVFIDNGLLRRDEAKQIVQRFKQHYHINLIHVNAQNNFLEKLKGIIAPEQKRRIIGKEFIRTFETQAKKIGKIKFLAQGTLYPDVIESRHITT